MYDVIVIGNDMSALVAATRAAQLGLKTVLLQDGGLPDRLSLSDYAFDVDPFPWPLVESVEAYPFLRSLAFAELSEAPRPDFQVILPEHRVDFFPGKYAQLKELARECPDQALLIERLLEAVLRGGLKIESLFPALRESGHFPSVLKALPGILYETASWKRQASALAGAPALKRILDAQFGVLSNRCENGKTPLCSAYILRLPFRDGTYASGKGEVIGEIRGHLSAFGGALIRGCAVERLLTGKEIEVSIREQDRDLILSGRALILSTKWTGLNRLVHDERISRWIAHRAERAGQSRFPFTMHMGVDARAFPEQMARYAAVESEDGPVPLSSCPLIFLEISAPGDLSRAPQGKRALSASVFLDRSPLEIEKEWLEGLAEAVFDRLRMFLPFLRENVDKIDMEKSIEWSIGMQSCVNGRYRAGRNGLLGFPMRQARGPKGNVVMTGGELLAGLGFAGEILSGLRAANRISGGKSS